MKKNGFTLAEVLITLSIIGVVATLTLPSLMTNTGEAQYKAGLKKAVNTLSEAGQMASALDGFDYSSMTVAAAAPSTIGCGMAVPQSISGILTCHAQVNTLNSTATNIILRDGTEIILPQNTITNGAGALIVGIDVNGAAKGPNLYSACANAGTAAQPAARGTAAQVNLCNTAATRSIKDRFVVELQGSAVNPFDAATMWALTR